MIYIFSIDGRPKKAADDLKPLYQDAKKALAENFAAVGFKHVSELPSYVTVARQIRNGNISSSIIYLDGAFSAVVTFEKIQKI